MILESSSVNWPNCVLFLKRLGASGTSDPKILETALRPKPYGYLPESNRYAIAPRDQISAGKSASVGLSDKLWSHIGYSTHNSLRCRN